MSKRLIFISISFISIALICLIGFQVAWYNNSYELKTQLYDHAIQAALKDVVTQIENREAANTITNRLEFIELKPDHPSAHLLSSLASTPSPALPRTSQPSHPTVKRKPLSSPSEHDTLSGIVFREIKTLRFDTTQLKKLNKISTVNSKMMVITDEEVDSVTLNKMIVRISHPVLVKESLNIEHIRTSNAKYATIKSSKFKTEASKNAIKHKLDDVLNKLVRELQWHDSSFSERIQKDTLENLISTALKNNGINSPFQFAVKKSVSEQTDIDNTGKTAFAIPLFPNDINSKSITLQLFLPERENLIKQSMYGHLAGSLIFTFIVLFAFAYTIYVMLKQKKLDEIKNDFINNMTHEFKTPIATISLAADTISNELTLVDKNKIIHYAGVIHEENQRMNKQVEKVLQLALTDKSSFEISTETYHLHQLINDILEKFTVITESEKRNIHLNLQAQNDLIVVDGFHIGNAISNMIDNAIKYSEAGTAITIETLNAGKSIFLSITDMGIGMKKDIQKKIFDKFYREQTGNIHNVKGFGIGLSYVKNVIDAHKGEIIVHSTPGRGSTFTIKINQ